MYLDTGIPNWKKDRYIPPVIFQGKLNHAKMRFEFFFLWVVQGTKFCRDEATSNLLKKRPLLSLKLVSIPNYRSENCRKGYQSTRKF